MKGLQMDDIARLKKNEAFAKSFCDKLLPLFDNNFIAARRAAGSMIVTLEGQKSGVGVQIRMLTSRGTPTFPIGGSKWIRTGESIVSHTRLFLDLIFVIIKSNWDEFLAVVGKPGFGIRTEIELRDIVTKLRPDFI
jgi:hypothetical protein